MYIQDVDFAPDSSWFAVAAFGFQFQTNWNSQNYYGRQLCDSSAGSDQQPEPAASELDQLQRR